MMQKIIFFICFDIIKLKILYIIQMGSCHVWYKKYLINKQTYAETIHYDQKYVPPCLIISYLLSVVCWRNLYSLDFIILCIWQKYIPAEKNQIDKCNAQMIWNQVEIHGLCWWPNEPIYHINIKKFLAYFFISIMYIFILKHADWD